MADENYITQMEKEIETSKIKINELKREIKILSSDIRKKSKAIKVLKGWKTKQPKKNVEQ